MKVRTIIQNGPPSNAGPGEDSIYGDSIQPIPAPVLFSLWDYSPLAGLHTRIAGLYAFVSRSSQVGTSWRGAELLYSDDGVDYNTAILVGNESILGETTNTLGNAEYGYPDIINVLNVIVIGTLSSISEADFYKGKNRAIIGGEVICFKNAVLQADGSYDLSVFLRGLRDTASYIGGHSSTERVIIINNSSFYPHADVLQNSTKYVKAIPIGGDPDDIEYEQHQIILGTLTPFKVAYFEGVETAGTIHYSWYRRSRADGLRLFSPVLLEEGELPTFQIAFYHTILGLVRSISTNVSYYDYTAAERATDGYGVGDDIIAEIHQMHPTYGKMGIGRYQAVILVE